MAGSALTPFPYIAEGSEATPGLWNNILSIFSQNVTEANTVSNLSSNVSTLGMVTINADSNVTDYIHFHDTSNARSDYILGSFTTKTADGLDLYDASGGTMIVSFSKQSVRFFQFVVGPVFDTGGALASTYNAAVFGGSNKSTQIQAAITQAVADGFQRVYVPSSMYPYDASTISFSPLIQMVREGGDWGIYDVIAYGADSSGVTDAGASTQAAISAATVAGGGTVFFSVGTYKYTGPLTVQAKGVRFVGTGLRASRLIYSGTTDFITLGANDGLNSGAANAYNGVVTFTHFRDLLLQGPNFAGATRGIVDWKSGNQIFSNVNFNAFGTAFFGLASDINSWKDCYFNSNGTAVYLASRSDQNHFDNCYFAQNIVGIQDEYAEGLQVVGGEFVWQTTADILFDAPSVGTLGSDTRTDIGAEIEGVWFESPTAPQTPRHIWVGRLGDSTRIIAGVNISKCRIEASSLLNFMDVDAGNNISIRRLYQAGTISGNLVNVNSVAGVTPVITVETPRMNPAANIYGGAGYTGAPQELLLVTRTTNAVAFNASLTVNARSGEIVEVNALTANMTVNAPTAGSSFRGMHLIFVLIQDATGGRTVTWNSIFKHTWSDAGNVANARSSVEFYYDGTNWIQIGQQKPWTTLATANYFADGTALAPGLAATSETSLGFWRSAASTVGLSYGQFQAPAFYVPTGSAIFPRYAFSSESSLGFYRSASSTLALSYGTLDTSNGFLTIGVGTSTVPSLAFNGDLATGIAWRSAGQYNLMSNSGVAARVLPSQFAFLDGSAILPALTNTSDRSLGFYRSGVSTLAISYGTLNLATQAVRLSMRTLAASAVTVSAAKTNVAVDEAVFTIGGASGASLCISSGGTLYFFNSAGSAALA